ncbi:DUF397 domain-containing protein [Micromonospora endophytica]|uniref:DUF397 domain-containing protein n=1 Tax=Micromonospora endophytica TaxID=515350 RepID=A0A2W2DB27_9ACTN|nr:DUF397 domain-containing protein [Micromonospora endophytica]PZG01149.1 DUF397 domain-containing protein [Micromonospora endophytica]RIW40738.1 DUF397 domain-containing protein [Micromonospora endophytica]BCJ61811.1 DUF397 domain-containing protein [Micromonospora endophytica]
MKALDNRWRTSSRSGGNGACVEARYANHATQVRDSKDQQGPVLRFSSGQWTGFIGGIKAGEFAAESASGDPHRPGR